MIGVRQDALAGWLLGGWMLGARWDFGSVAGFSAGNRMFVPLLDTQ